MNRFPLWKYLLIGLTLVVAFLYTAPNFFGEVPAVQVSPLKTTDKADAALLKQAQTAVQAAGVKLDSAFIDGNSVKLRFASTDDQIKAKDALQAVLGERNTVALNLLRDAAPAAKINSPALVIEKNLFVYRSFHHRADGLELLVARIAFRTEVCA